MKQPKKERLANKVDVYDLVNDRISQVAEDNKLTEEEKSELGMYVWSLTG